MVQKSIEILRSPVEDGSLAQYLRRVLIYISGSSPDFMNYQQRINWKNEAFQDGSKYDVFSNGFPYQQVGEKMVCSNYFLPKKVGP